MEASGGGKNRYLIAPELEREEKGFTEGVRLESSRARAMG